MTTEEKARAYEMALEAARKELGVDRKEWEIVQRVLHNIFPELRESEDERIRKAIIKSIEEDSSVYEQEVSKESMLAYLEKQKESLHISESCKENANSFTDESEDSKTKQEILHYFNVELLASKDEEEKEILKKWIAYLERQKEIQFGVPGLYYYDGKNVHFYGSPVTEENLESQDIDFSTNDTNKNDARKRRQIIALLSASKGKCMASFAKDIDECVAYLIEKQKEQTQDEKEYVRTLEALIADFLRGKKEVDREYYQRIWDWLENRHVEQKEQKPNIELIQRSWYMEGYHDREFGKEPKWIIKTGEGGPKHELNPKYGQPLAGEPKPAEWSEEDERHLRLATAMLQASKEKCMAGFYKDVDESVAWLQSLRPSWKPSKEQMKVLLNAEGLLRADKRLAMAQKLAELYEQLKKLQP